MSYRRWASTEIPGLEGLFEIVDGDDVSLRLNNRKQVERYEVRQIDGLLGTPGVRETRNGRTGDHGTERGIQKLDEKVIAFDGQVIAGTFKRLREMQRALDAVCGPDHLDQTNPDRFKLKIYKPETFVLNNYGVAGGAYINWISNPDFDGSDGWDWNPSTLSVTFKDSGGERRFGRFAKTSAQLQTVGSLGAGAFTDVMGEKIPLDMSQPQDWSLTLFMRITQATGTANISIGINCYDASGTGLNGVMSTTWNTVGSSVVGITILAANLGPAAMLQPMIRIAGGGSGGALTAEVTNVMLEKSSTARPYVGPFVPGSSKIRLRSGRIAWAGLRPHNLCPSPSGAGLQPPLQSANCTVRPAEFPGLLNAELSDDSSLDIASVAPVMDESRPAFMLKALTSANMSIGERFIPASAGTRLVVSGYFQSVTTQRQARITIQYRDGSGALHTTATSTSVTEISGQSVRVYFESDVPNNIVSADVNWEIVSPLSGERHFISGRRITLHRLGIGSHEDIAEPTDPGWTTLGDKVPFAQTFFTSNAISFTEDQAPAKTLTFDEGSLNYTGTGAVPTTTGRKRLYSPLAIYRDCEVSFRFNTGGTVSSTEKFVMLRRVDSTNYYTLGITGSSLAIYSTVDGVVTLHNGTIPTFAINTEYWIRARAEGRHLSVEIFIADPDTSDPYAAVEHEIDEETDQALAFGYAGLMITPGDLTEQYEVLRIKSNVYVNAAPASYGASYEEAPRTYVLEQLDFDVKQIESQATNDHRRPFLLTAKARDPRFYWDQTESAEVSPKISSSRLSFVRLGDVSMYDQFVVGPTINYSYPNGYTQPDGSTTPWEVARIPSASVLSRFRFSEIRFRYFRHTKTFTNLPRAGVVLKYQANDDHLFVFLEQGGMVRIYKRQGGVASEIASYQLFGTEGSSFPQGDVWMRAWVDEFNRVEVRVSQRGPIDIYDQDLDLFPVTHQLVGGDVTAFGYNVAGRYGWYASADSTPTHVPQIYSQDEGAFAAQEYGATWFDVRGTIDTPATFEIVGPVANPTILVPESGIEIRTSLNVAVSETATIERGRVTGSVGDNSDILAGTKVVPLLPIQQRLQMTGQNMDPALTRARVYWRNAEK